MKEHKTIVNIKTKFEKLQRLNMEFNNDAFAKIEFNKKDFTERVDLVD